MLPPTESAAKQHLFRVYFQVQQWFGNTMDPTNWGWEIKEDKLQPTYTNDLLVPENILRDISCRCVKACTKVCSCVKHGLKCTDYCSGCHGKTCKNSEETIKNSNVDLDESVSTEGENSCDSFELNHEIQNTFVPELKNEFNCESDDSDDDSYNIPCKKAKRN